MTILDGQAITLLTLVFETMISKFSPDLFAFGKDLLNSVLGKRS
jgi:hypothetical protein